MEPMEESLNAVVSRLRQASQAMMARCSDGAEVSVRDLKDLLGTVKEILNLQDTLSRQKPAPREMTVTFEGEADQWSR